MPTMNKIVPLNEYQRLHIVRCEGDVSILHERLGFRWCVHEQIDITQEQAVGLAMALLEGTGFRVTK